MSYKLIAAVAAAILTAACGGGGGGGGGGSTPPPNPPPVAFSPATLAANYGFGTSQALNVQVAVTDTAAFSGVTTLYVYIVDSQHVLSTYSLNRIDATHYSVALTSSGALAQGHYTGNFQIELCKDAGCATQVSGSPVAYPFDFTVTTGPHWPVVTSSKGSVATAGGGGLALSAAAPNGGSAAATTWTALPSGVGTLSATSGATVTYVPPSAPSLSATTSVTISATLNGRTTDFPVTVYPNTFGILAGAPGAIGNANGTGPAASFYEPIGVASDTAGNLYVADRGNSLIRKITPAGVVTTFAGTPGIYGSADGPASSARFYGPAGVAIDLSGNLYVADSANNTIRKITPAGVVSTLAGTAGVTGRADGTGAAASFSAPYGIAVDSAGTVYVSDQNNQTIRQITSAGVVSTLAGSSSGLVGSTDGTGTAARFSYPAGVALDGNNHLFVADGTNSTVRRIDITTKAVTTYAGTAGVQGHADGTGAAASFNIVDGIAVDGAGNVFVSDTDNSIVRKIDTAQAVTTIAGTAFHVGQADGTGAAASFTLPRGITIDGSGNLYLADTFNDVIRKISSTYVVTTLAGAAGNSGSADGTGNAAGFNLPAGIAHDPSGNFYVADTHNNTVRKITAAGVVTTLAGFPGSSGSSDGTGSAAAFTNPAGIATDSASNIYVADTLNATVRKVTPAGVVTTLAGSPGVFGYIDGTGAAARFTAPSALATDSTGNLYVADGTTVRKITPAGVVTTLAGSGGSTGTADGTGSTARFNYPLGIATDTAGNVYVADSGNMTIRKVTQAGVVTTLAGTAGTSGVVDGTGVAALFKHPYGIATDAADNVYVSDDIAADVRKITPAGVVTTLVGPGILTAPKGLTVVGNAFYTTENNGVVDMTF